MLFEGTDQMIGTSNRLHPVNLINRYPGPSWQLRWPEWMMARIHGTYGGRTWNLSC